MISQSLVNNNIIVLTLKLTDRRMITRTV